MILRIKAIKDLIRTASYTRLAFLLFCLLVISYSGYAQNTPPPSSVVHIIHTDRLQVTGDIKKLKGDIQLKKNDTYFFCDEATIQDQQVYAKGNVRIEQGDSIFINANTLDFSSKENKAKLKGNVSLKQDALVLTTQQLDYDLNKKIGYYDNYGTIQDTSITLKSKKGVYYSTTQKAYFEQEVTVEADSFLLEADTLEHSLAEQVSYFIGPTSFISGDNKGYTEDGFFNHKTKYSELYTNAQFQDTSRITKADTIKYIDEKDYIELIGNARYEDRDSFQVVSDRMTYNRKLDFYTLEGKSYVQKNQQIISANNANYNAEKEQIVFWDDVRLNDNSYFLKADSIFYDQVTEFATAVSSAHLFDTLSNNHLYGDKMEYYKKENKAFATDSPYGIHYMESDSLILSADTLSTYVDKQDTTRRVITGYNDVKYYLTDVQGIADSLSYVEQDSVLSIYGTPYVWSDSMQVSGDKLFIYLSTQDDIDSIRIVNNAFVINTADFIFFNQIKGKEMIADFLLGALQEVNVIGNGESLYFIQDEDDAYVGKNKSICGRMRIVLKDSQLEEMVFYNKPSAQLLPLGNSPMSIDNFLKGYNWDMSKRPKSFDSLKE